MEERKTAAYVLSVVALIGIWFFVVVPYRDLHKTYTLSFKTCKVDFNYRYKVDTADYAYEIAQNELGLCLCNAYIKHPDTATAKQIMKIYKRYGGNSACPDTVNCDKYNNLDSILKRRDIVFNHGWDD